MGQDSDGGSGAGGVADRDRRDFEHRRRARRLRAKRLRRLGLLVLAAALVLTAAYYAPRRRSREVAFEPPRQPAGPPGREAVPDRPLADVAREAGLETDPIPDARPGVVKSAL